MTEQPFPIEYGQVLAFSRALGRPDSDTDAGLVPPTYPIAMAHYDPDWPLRLRPGLEWKGSGAGPGTSGAGGGLHAEQEFVYHRSLRVGETLTARPVLGETWSKQGRSGTLTFTERHLDFTDAEGELVVRSTTVTVTNTPPSGNDEETA